MKCLRPIVALVAAAGVAAGVAAGDGARAWGPGSGTTPAVTAADPDILAVTGVYALESNPGMLIELTALGHGRLAIVSSDGWDALGWYAHGDFVGTWRRPAPGEDRFGPTAYGWLWFHPQPDRSISVRFTDESGGSARTQRWKYRYGSGQGPGPAPEDSLEGPPPVYAEALPEAILRVPPNYPDEARRQHVEGTVLLQALVGKDGNVHDTRVLHSIPALDSAAVAAVRQWHFKPATSEGKPIAVWVAVPVKFSLH